MTRATRRLAIAATLAVTALLALAGTAGAADGTWERTWGRDVIQATAPTNIGTGFEICTVATDCKFGTGGSLGGESGEPKGVDVDAGGNVYVADDQNQRIQKFDSSGNFLRAWGNDVVESGPGETPSDGFEICVPANGDVCKQGVGFGGGDGGELSAPQDVAVDSSGNVYVAEGQRIQKFDTNGVWERAWGRDVVDGGGTGAEVCTVAANCKLGDLNGDLGGEFRSPRGVGIDSAGNVYVADEDRQRIQKFEPDGDFLLTWGKDVASAGPGNTGTGFEICVAANGDTCKTGVAGPLGGEFNSPRTVSVDAAGGVYVGDISNQRIDKFDTSGNFVRAWGKDVVSAGPGDTGVGFEICVAANGDTCKQGVATTGLGGEFVNPIDVEAVASGVYVTDRDNLRLQRFDSSGNFVRAWGNDVVQEDKPGDADPNGFEVCTAALDCQSGQGGAGLGGELAQPYGIGADDSGNVYASSPGAQWISKFVDGAPPAAPTITDTDPDSPAEDNDPEVKGTTAAVNHITVRLYKDDPTCSGTPDATGTVAQFTGSGITVNVAEDSTTALHASLVTAAGHVSPCSAAFNYVELAPPQNTSPPSIPNSGEPGDELTCNPGTWTGSPTFEFEWLSDGVAISGETSSTYDVQAADQGHSLSCRVTATNAAGNSQATSNAATITANTPPDTTITSGPGTTTDHTPTFTFVSNEAGSTFQCSVDDGPFAACGTPFTTASLPDGSHKLEVRAIDGLAAIDATPATRSFQITTPAAPAPAACSDGVDNDKDGAIDQRDPGCLTSSDTFNPADHNEGDENERQLVLCGSSAIKLVRADAKGRTVVLSGFVASRFAGRTVALRVRLRGKFKTLKSVKAKADGRFRATVKGPPKRLFTKARYQAVVAGKRSIGLKLPQSLASSALKKQGNTLVLRGKVKRSVLGKRNPVIVRRLVCGQTQIAGKAKPAPSGAYVVRFPAPAQADAALYRAEAKVLARPGSTRYVRQSARAIGVSVGG